MTEKDFFAEITQVFKKNSLSSLLSKEKTEKLYKLTERLITENEKYNLTAITEPKRIILQHYADCATLAAHLPKNARICDVGCGAGFPSARGSENPCYGCDRKARGLRKGERRDAFS